MKCYICNKNAVAMKADLCGGSQFSPRRYYGVCKDHINAEIEKPIPQQRMEWEKKLFGTDEELKETKKKLKNMLRMK